MLRTADPRAHASDKSVLERVLSLFAFGSRETPVTACFRLRGGSGQLVDFERMPRR
jgi:hypothetical protein